MFYAHSLVDQPDKSQWHTLQDHLQATGALAAEFAREFGAENAGMMAGLWHDLGKYTSKFQGRLSGSQERVDHSTAGAREIRNRTKGQSDLVIAELLSYAIAGHHAGLADPDELRRRLKSDAEILDEAWQHEIKNEVGPLWVGLPHLSKDKTCAAFQLAFLGRMIFSCLVDADFKDTERFHATHAQKTIDRAWPDLRQCADELICRFDAHMSKLQERPGPINNLRQDILKHVRAKAMMDPGLFTLTVPTGGGKTLASLGFALDHAKAHNLRRIIYAIPFTSIIDQSATIFRDVLGEGHVLEHHASIEEDRFADYEQRDKLRLAMEDWAAPVIATTNVQLFESLFANRPSRCRKLHNLAHSVLILDEVQTLPLRYLRPCLAALDELAKNYKVSVVLCTATQPAFDKRTFKHGGLDLEGRELAPDPDGLFSQLKRVTITREGEWSDAHLIAALRDHQQGLVIVNTRKHALRLHRMATEAGLDGVVHLTTRQCARDRRAILQRVKDTLKADAPCRLIATSLIEAGVDIDFPCVWRAEAGLDQIAQAAGRCNREGKHSHEESIVTVFKSAEHKPPPEIAQLAADFAAIADKHNYWLSRDAINDYFSEVFWRKGAGQLDQKKILEQFSISEGRPSCAYRTVAEAFQMIESGLRPIIIPGDPAVADILGRLNSSDASAGKAARELQTFIVQVPPRDFENLQRNGRVQLHREDLWGTQFAVLTDASLYQPEIGLIWEDADVLNETIF
ncbi:MAG: CRISPR-associated helicase Cas3' [Alphaproteobacteria bacterium]|nr:MAG: CRISPR-associated helicase Cas3' [Alphaproteobacteria bacterium]